MRPFLQVLGIFVLLFGLTACGEGKPGVGTSESVSEETNLLDEELFAGESKSTSEPAETKEEDDASKNSASNSSSESGDSSSSVDDEPKDDTEDLADHQFKVPIVSVIDGDTIKVKINGKEENVRFLLVDTPETNHPRLGEQPFGEEAKVFTKKLLSGSYVILEKDVSERDKYGRLLMYVYTEDGKSVQEELLKNGLARVAYVYAPNTKYVDQYYAIQKEAQKRAVGIWSVENYATEDGYNPEVFEKETAEKPKEEPKAQLGVGSFPPDENGNCQGHIKGNQGSNGWIYHMPDGQFYDQTKAEECFTSEEAALDAGYRKSQR